MSYKKIECCKSRCCIENKRKLEWHRKRIRLQKEKYIKMEIAAKACIIYQENFHKYSQNLNIFTSTFNTKFKGFEGVNNESKNA